VIFYAACAALWVAVLIMRPTLPPFAGEQGDLLLAHERRRHGWLTLLATVLTFILLFVALVQVLPYTSDLSRMRGDGCDRLDYCWHLDDNNQWHISQT
jgi:hypothetical protein